MDINKIFEIIKKFLSDSNLLRIACLGNAEKTIQGELFNHLRCAHKLNAVIECGYRDVDDRHIDIMVFDNNWFPIVAIELKHYSPHQGTINPLLGGLEDDYNKLRQVGLPLIQVGLYTSIDSISQFPLPPITSISLNYYRFLMTYVVRHFLRLNNGNWNHKFDSDKLRVEEWGRNIQPQGRYSESPTLVSGPEETFQLKDSSIHDVKGRVNWIALLAN